MHFLSASEEINARPHEYNALMLDVARSFSLQRILRCTQIMGRGEKDDLSAAQILYPCMQCADIFYLKARRGGTRSRRHYMGPSAVTMQRGNMRPLCSQCSAHQISCCQSAVNGCGRPLSKAWGPLASLLGLVIWRQVISLAAIRAGYMSGVCRNLCHLILDTCSAHGGRGLLLGVAQRDVGSGVVQADICQLGMDQRKVNVLAREYCDKIKRKLKPVILSHEMLPGLLEVPARIPDNCCACAGSTPDAC